MTATTFTEDDYREGMAALAKAENAQLHKVMFPSGSMGHNKKGRPPGEASFRVARLVDELGPVSVSEIAELIGAERSALSTIMSNLRTSGVVMCARRDGGRAAPSLWSTTDYYDDWLEKWGQTP
jgi:DNA-binding transcriptional ArsR family regulator